MATSKRVGFGAALAVDPTGGSSYAALGAIVEGFEGPDADRDDVETTLLSDTWKTYAPGQNEPGEVTFSIAYDPNDADNSQKLGTLHTQLTPIPSWQITYPVSASTTETQPTETFTAYVKGLGRSVVKDSLIMQEVTLKVTGNPGFATT